MQRSVSSLPADWRIDMEDGWISWSRKEPLIMLTNDRKTDSRYVSVGEVEQGQNLPMNPDLQTAYIQNNQYRSVLTRINEAVHRTSSYSSWT